MSVSSFVPTSEGKIEFHVDGETHYTPYKLFGDLKSGHRPLVTLHGGPGAASCYLLSISDLFTSYGTPVIFYDQLGGGESRHLPHKPKDFWTPTLFMDELENLLAYFGISDDYDLLGHSWGGMLGAQFAAERTPKGLRHLVISCSPASMDLWEQVAPMLLSGMPQVIQDTLKKHEDAGTTGEKEYHDALDVFYAKHLCRLQPMPVELQRSFDYMSAYPTVYETMNGPSEFHVIGTLKGWSVIDKLPNITAMALILNGRYDEAQDLCVAPYFMHIPKAKWITFAESSHLPQWEERERYMQVVHDFLNL